MSGFKFVYLAAQETGERLSASSPAERKTLHAFIESEALDLIRAGKREEARRIAHELLQAEEKEGEK